METEILKKNCALWDRHSYFKIYITFDSVHLQKKVNKFLAPLLGNSSCF